MTLRYIGYSISALFALSSIVLLGVSFCDIIKRSLQFPTEDSLKAGIFYMAFGILFFLLSIFTLLTTENGFSWENLVILLLITSAIFAFMTIDYFVRRRSLHYINKHLKDLASLSTLLHDNPIRSTLEKRHIIKKPDTEEKKQN